MTRTLASEFSDRVERQIGRDPASASEWLAGEWWTADAEARAAWVRALAELGETGSSSVRAEVLAVLGRISDPAIDALLLRWLAAPPAWLADPHPTRGPDKALWVPLVEAALANLFRKHPEARATIAQRAREHGLEDQWLLVCIREDADGEGRAAFAARVSTGRALGSLANTLGCAFGSKQNYLEGVAIAAACPREDREAFLAGMSRGFSDAASLDEIRRGLGLGAGPDGPGQREPDRQVVLTGGARGNRVEVARAGDVIVSVGLCDGWPKPWDVVARCASDARAFEELAAHWLKQFPVAAPATGTRAHALADELRAHPQRWVVYRYGGIDGAETCRILDLGARVAFEKLGKTRRLQVFADVAQALARTGPKDVACGLGIPTATEREAIDALGAPRKARARREKVLGAGATLSQRLTEAFSRLEASRVLALSKVAGTQSDAWGVAAVARHRSHAGAVFYLAEHWRKRASLPVLELYWASWDPGADPGAFAQGIVDVLVATGVEASAPADQTQSITIHTR